MPLVSLRPATFADAERIFTWRNSPFILSRGSSQRPVRWDEHQRWFTQTITSAERLLLIISHADTPIGQVRFDQQDEQTCVVSIYLTAESVGRGFGVQALKHACWEVFAQRDIGRIVAFVRCDNAHSVRAFEKAGFVRVEPADEVELQPEHITFRLSRPEAIPHNRLTHGTAETQAVLETVRSGQWTSGQTVARLEASLAQMAGVKHAVCVASGLSALRLALMGLGVKPGQTVFVPAYSCVALANAVLACGAHPFPVDVRPDEWNCDPSLVGQARAEGPSAALIAVNTFGLPAPIERLRETREAGIPIIEDCAHAFGITVNGRPLGSRADAGILSFYATKLIGAGEGGAVLTDSDELADFVRTWRDYADQPPDGTRLNDKMTDIEASLALCQLERLSDTIKRRQALAERYHTAFTDEADCTGLFRLPDQTRPRVWYRYAVSMRSQPATAIVEQLHRYGVRADIPVTDWRPHDGPLCPHAAEAYERVVSLPLYPTLTPHEQDRIIHAFLVCCQEAAYA